MQQYHKQLKELRNKLASNKMSLLVGSGLSKNVSAKFLTWDELLIDLAYELNERTINSAYDHYVGTASTVVMSEENFKKDQCLHIIRQQGYLEIVSEYIKRKAIPESITTYIEERIPGVFKKDGAYFLECNGTIEPLPREKLALHKSLIDLPWNNIYTTNYDDLLDVCIDSSRYQRLIAEIRQLDTEIAGLDQEIRVKEEKKESLNKPTARPDITESGSTPLEGLEPVPLEDPKLNNELEQLSFDIGRLKKRLQEKELLLSEKTRESDECFQVVKTATGLRIKKSKNIIKLHGSLRSGQERAEFSFGFDGDHKKQYVISKEDYESYPTNHEAFTQLMRISLLQESFCLIGFSGVDPNFLQWINWVRDILYKAARLNDQHNKQYKIYLIDSGEEKVSADKQLFYENHNIVRIPLRDPGVIALFREDLGEELTINDRATAITALISYLGNDDQIRPVIPSPDISIRGEYRQLWDELGILEPNKIPEEHTIAPMLSRLEAIGQQIWLPDLSYHATHNQHSLLSYVNNQSWYQQLPQRPLLSKLVIMALRDMAVPIRSFLEQEVIAQLASGLNNQIKVEKAISRNNALSGVSEKQPVSRVDEMLYFAYSFQFSKLHNYLENWEANGRDQIIRSGFLAIFDIQEAVDRLSADVTNETFNSGEEKLYALEMLHHFTHPFITKNSSRISRLIVAYERSGYTGLQDRLQELQKQIAKKLQEIKPYGDKRFGHSRSVRLSKHTEAEAAVQLLMLLAESGFQMMIRNIYLLSSEDWYWVMKAGFEFYPLPILFYTLQYSKKDFLKKAGQDYAFSNAEKVSEQLPMICNALFINLADAPKSYADNIQVFLSSLVIGVDPAIWEKHFSNWWRDLVKQGIAFRKHHLETHTLLINACIQYIADRTVILEITGNCLDAVLRGEVDQPINFLYYLNRNQHFKEMTKSGLAEQPFSAQLDAVIAGLDTDNISRIFILGNLFKLLTPPQLEQIKAQLLEVDFGMVSSARIWRILLHFAKGKPELGDRIRQALITHRNLWYTGIDGNKISRGVNDEPILVSFLSYSVLHPNGLIWNDEELKEIYNRLLIALADLERVAISPDFFFSFTPVLEEMVEFLSVFQSQIGSYNDYNETISRARNQLNIHRKYNELEEGLTSRDENAVNMALGELDVRVYKNYYQHDNVTLVLNKILLQAEPAVESALGYMTSWLYNRRYPERFRDQEALLLRILRKYEAQPLEDGDIAYVEEKLVRIAWQLRRWNNTDLVVTRWLEHAEQSRFNNVRQFIASQKVSEKDQDIE